jgi:hypothetical protein
MRENEQDENNSSTINTQPSTINWLLAALGEHARRQRPMSKRCPFLVENF